jgi:hypothetical protein
VRGNTVSIFAKILAAIDGEFDRRLRRASDLDAAPRVPPAPEADDEGAEIVNIPRGAPAPAPEADDDEGAEIVNIPRGADRG